MNLTRCVPVAKPGIRSKLKPGETLIFRAPLDFAEVETVCRAVRAGTPDRAFLLSSLRLPEVFGAGPLPRALRGRLRQGIPAVLGYEHVTAARPREDLGGGLRLIPRISRTPAGDWSQASADAWAIALPVLGVLWRNPRLDRGDLLDSLTSPEGEVIFDARTVRAVWRVPRMVQVSLIRDRVRWAMYRGLGRDHDLAAAIADAVDDLRRPPEQLQRPFIERPVKLRPGLSVRRGDRVLLVDGQVVQLKAMGAVNPAYFRGHSRRFEVAGFKGWGASHWALSGGINIIEDLIARKLRRGESVTSAERERTWRKHRNFLRGLMETDLSYFHGEDEGTREHRRRIKHDIQLTTRETPPWRDPMLHSAVLRYGKKPRKT
jgi:hypothetical protein